MSDNDVDIQDIENRPVRRIKRDDPDLRANVPQASKRAALGILPVHALRVQPFRTAKQSTAHENVCQGEKSGKIISSTFANKAVSEKSAFTIHNDNEPSRETKSSAQQPFVQRLHIHTAVTQLHRQPFALIPQQQIDKDDEDDDSDSTDSQMVLDVSVNEERTKEIRSSYEPFLHCDEYSRDIYQYLRETELRNRPKPHYLRKQPDITAGMRSILVDWLIEVGEEYKLESETIYLSINYIDRFLSCMSVLRGKLQLVGTACMFIAAKYEEIYPPDVNEFVYITDDTYTKKQVLRMEHLVLKVLAFDLAVPTIFYFLQYYCKLGSVSNTTEFLTMYLCELTLLEAEPYLNFHPSIVAGSALFFAQYLCGETLWDENMQMQTGYKADNFRECLYHMHNTLRMAPNFPQQAVREKYRSHKFLGVADMNPPERLPFD